LPPGLAGHESYRIVRLIGAGGMGTVYEAEHRVLHRPVALKVIKRSLTDHPVIVERFRREVRAAARLSHQNIVTICDAEDAGGTLFLVMEYVEGVSLGRLVKERGPLPVAEACDAVRQTALGLQHAHERGVVHRDVKPENLIRCAGGTVKVLDFGLAALTAERGGALTDTNVIMGTPDYMAPEQAEDPRSADVRADVYSLGCTLYHLLTGRVPYPASTRMQKLLAHREQPLPSIRQACPEVPVGLACVLERMLAKRPDDRYQTPGEAAAALAPFTVVGASPRRPRRRRLVAALAALLLAGMALTGAAVYRIQTDKGELVITAESDDVEVVIKQGGKVVRLIDTKTDKQITLTLRSGTYELELKGDPKGLKLKIDKATLTRGEKVLAEIVRKEPPKPEDGDSVSDRPKLIAHLAVPGAHLHPGCSTFSTDGRLLVLLRPSWTGNPSIRILDAQTGLVKRTFGTTASSTVTGALVTPDGKELLTCHEDRSFRLWDLSTGTSRPLDQLKHPGKTISLWAFSPDGKYVAASEFAGNAFKQFHVWEFETGKERVLAAPLAPDSMQYYCRFSPDGKHLVTVDSPGTAAEPEKWAAVRLHDVATGEARTIRVKGWVGGRGVAFREEGRQIGLMRWTKEEGYVVEFIDLRTSKSVERIPVGVQEVEAAYLSPDGRYFVWTEALKRTARFFDLHARKVTLDEKDVSELVSVLISPDSRRVAVGGENSVSLFRLPDPKPEKDKP
jgi:WD40 repeat protein/tRNA A-37 threonylcarbamoyl transferase component Bud32